MFTWNTNSPSGSLSVKANRSPMSQNTKYIENMMGKLPVGTNTINNRDHFWNLGPTLSGHHRFMQSPRFTSTAGLPSPDDVNPLLGSDMDGCLYLRLVNSDVGTVQGFYRNIGVGGGTSIYQYIPTYVIANIAAMSESYQVIATVPKNVYGYIEWYIVDPVTGKYEHLNSGSGFGYFISNETNVDAWQYTYLIEGTNAPSAVLKFGNGADSSGLNLRARSQSPAFDGAHVRFKITYRAIDQDG